MDISTDIKEIKTHIKEIKEDFRRHETWEEWLLKQITKTQKELINKNEENTISWWEQKLVNQKFCHKLKIISWLVFIAYLFLFIWVIIVLWNSK